MIPPMRRTVSLSLALDFTSHIMSSYNMFLWNILAIKLRTIYMLRWGIKVILKIEDQRSKINLKRSPLVIFSPKRSRSPVVILKIKIKDRDLCPSLYSTHNYCLTVQVFWMCLCSQLQGSRIRLVRGLVNFVPALA